jgi:hypothetical protein
MTLDTIDRAFVARWKARRLAAEPRPLPAVCEPVHTATLDSTVIVEPEPSIAAEPPVDISAFAEDTASEETVAEDCPTEDSLVARLLGTGRMQWETLADEVEAARLAGHRTIAIVGGEQGEGRTTLVACLARTLCDRGRDTVVLEACNQAPRDDGSPADGGQLNDRRIVLVDAGIWFPPGVIRRQRLGMASAGCDAAILVRRADRDPVPARVSALAALGVTVLGEVVTFAPSGEED